MDEFLKHSAMSPLTYLKSKVGLDITGQTGVVDTVILVKTNKQDCVWAPSVFVSISLVINLLVFFIQLSQLCFLLFLKNLCGL